MNTNMNTILHPYELRTTYDQVHYLVVVGLLLLWSLFAWENTTWIYLNLHEYLSLLGVACFLEQMLDLKWWVIFKTSLSPFLSTCLSPFLSTKRFPMIPLNSNFIFVLSLILIFNLSTQYVPSIHLNQMALYSLLIMLLAKSKLNIGASNTYKYDSNLRTFQSKWFMINPINVTVLADFVLLKE